MGEGGGCMRPSVIAVIAFIEAREYSFLLVAIVTGSNACFRRFSISSSVTIALS